MKALHFLPKFQVSFMVPKDAIPGRLGLLLTLFLCAINTLIATQRSAPKSGGTMTGHHPMDLGMHWIHHHGHSWIRLDSFTSEMLEICQDFSKEESRERSGGQIRGNVQTPRQDDATHISTPFLYVCNCVLGIKRSKLNYLNLLSTSFL